MYLTLHDPVDCSPPGSSVHGILQARIPEWVAMLSSRGSSRPRERTHVSYVSCIGRWVFCSCFLPLVPPGKGFPWSSVGKESACNAGDPSLRRRDRLPTPVFLGFPGGSDGKRSICNVGDLGLIPGLGRSPGGEHGNSLQYSWLENPHGQRSLAGYSPQGCKESDMTEQLSTAQHVITL